MHGSDTSQRSVLGQPNSAATLPTHREREYRSSGTPVSELRRLIVWVVLFVVALVPAVMVLSHNAGGPWDAPLGWTALGAGLAATVLGARFQSSWLRRPAIVLSLTLVTTLVPIWPGKVSTGDRATAAAGTAIYQVSISDLPGSLSLWWFSNRRFAEPLVHSADGSGSDDSVAELQAAAAANGYLGTPTPLAAPDPLIVESRLEALAELLPGDELVSINGAPVLTTEELLGLANGIGDGETVTIETRRDGQLVTVETTDVGDPYLGLRIDQPVALTSLDGAVNADSIVMVRGDPGSTGSSNGLALALTHLTSIGELTVPGRVVATGTMDQHGRVGSVGGTERKYLAAVDAGACAFVLPANTTQPAPGPVPIYAVTTLTDAVEVVHGLDCAG